MNAEIEMIDTHAHLYLKEFDDDRDAVVQRAQNLGVTKIFLPNIDSDSIASMLRMTEEYPGVCYAMMGLHPCSVKTEYLRELEIVEEWLGKRRFSAVGEIGTDLYWDTSFRKQQETCFRRQIALAGKMQLPVVIHSRESLDWNIEIVTEMQDGSLSGVFHCFTGTPELARRIIELGFFLGIGGVITFKNSGLAETVQQLPLESLLLETDAPYLTPHPYRGKRNETSYVRLVAEKIAACKGVSLQAVCEVTSLNAQKLFVLNNL